MPLTKDFNLFDSYLLEASAGTGKTFTIAHLFIRFLLEKTPLEKILVVTFTRAAAAELKERIRAQIKQVIEWLETGQAELGYLESFKDSPEALSLLRKAVLQFDHAAIMTIHAFCGRMLSQAGMMIEGLESGFESEEDEKMSRLVNDMLFFSLQKSGFLPAQLIRLENRVNKIESWSLRHLKERGRVENKFKRLDEKALKSELELHMEGVSSEELRERYHQKAKGYNKLFDRKGNLFPEYEKAIGALAAGGSLHDLIEGAEAFLHLSEDNLNKRKKTPPPEDRVIDGIRDLLKELFKHSDEKAVLSSILSGIQTVKNEAKHYFQSHDNSLETMHSALDIPQFLTGIRDLFDAVMVDEFQDTDPLQWSIFSRVFLNTKPLFLVGDPKQSIYSFRKADVYTYLEAGSVVSDKIILNTNWRSTPELVDCFNHLFSQKPWLNLPKTGQFLEGPLLLAGKKEEGLKDGLGAVHFLLLKEGLTKKAQETLLLEAIVFEIEKFPKLSTAILVSDKGQAKRVEQFLKRKGLAVSNWQRLSKDDDEGDLSFKILLEALLRPEKSRAALLLPLFGWSVEEVLSSVFEKAQEEFYNLKNIWSEKGFAACIEALFSSRFLAKPGLSLSHLGDWLNESREGRKIFLEVKHQAEELVSLAWMRHPHLPEQLLSHFDQHMGEGRKSEEGINILTTHASKGLEFDVVFAFGLGFSSGGRDELFSFNRVIKIASPEDSDYQLYSLEKEAEKLRQLYVAMTRAKKRLYLPYIPQNKESPLNLFLEKQKEGPLLPWLEELSKKTAITFSGVEEKVQEKTVPTLPSESLIETCVSALCFEKERILSFTALARGKEKDPLEPDLNQMPAGAHVGEVLHQIFEELPWSDFSFEAIREFSRPYFKNSPLETWEDEASWMILKALQKPLRGFKLSDIPSRKVMREIEFLHKREGRYLKGFIDLAFEREGEYFLVDWKSNRLASYDQEAMKQEIESADYFLQANIYLEAFNSFLKGRGVLKGIFYVFLRGLDDDGVFYVEKSK